MCLTEMLRLFCWKEKEEELKDGRDWMMRGKIQLVLLKASCFWLDYKLKRSPLFILVAPPQPMARIVPTQM